MVDAVVQYCETLADDGIASAGEPARLVLRQSRHIAAKHIHKQRLGHLGQHRIAAGTIGRRLVDEEQQRAFEPVPRAIGPHVHLEH